MPVETPLVRGLLYWIPPGHFQSSWHHSTKTSWLWCLSSVFSQQTACSTTFSTSPSLFGKYVQCRESQLLPHKLAGTMATAHHQFIAYNSTVAFNWAELIMYYQVLLELYSVDVKVSDTFGTGAMCDLLELSWLTAEQKLTLCTALGPMDCLMLFSMLPCAPLNLSMMSCAEHKPHPMISCMHCLGGHFA